MTLFRSTLRAALPLALALAGTGPAKAASSPYPPSTAIPGITFSWETYEQRAPGSDNWPVTWAADDQLYASWGDGGGFGSDGVRGKVSLGVGRVGGLPGSGTAENVWGGLAAKSPATFPGKSRGILAVRNDLYLWRCGAGSGPRAYDFQQLHKSGDGGRTWRSAGWQFPASVTFYCPTFLQFGQGHAGARDGYVYMYAPERSGAGWGVQKPGRIALMRSPKDRLLDRSSYEFFTGTDPRGTPLWTSDVAARGAVFTDPNGTWSTSAIYNPGLGRYLLVTPHAPNRQGGVGIFDAPEPWGPWTTVLYQDRWGLGRLPETTTFFLNFAAKWWGDGGRNFVLVFSGDTKLDAWNSVAGSFLVGAPAGTGSARSR